jgi:hypothetical protein
MNTTFSLIPTLRARSLSSALAAIVGVSAAVDCFANDTIFAVRCDNAQSDSDFKGCVLGTTTADFSTGGRYCGMNVINQSAGCFSLLYEPEIRRHYAFSTPVPDAVNSRLSLLSQAYHLDPVGFSEPKNYFANQSVLPWGPYDPVQVSVNGWQSSERGDMNRAVNECMTAISCIRSVSSALALRLEGSYELTGLRLQIGPAGGLTVNWNYFAAQLGLPAVVWFCDDATNCAKYRFESNEWVFKETRAGQGEGPAYGNPDFTASLSWSNIDGAIIADGMRRAGYTVPSWQYNVRLLCGWVNGVLDSCRWVPYY